MTINEGFGARQMALGNSFLGMSGDGTFLVNHPAALNDASQLEFTLGHTQKFFLSSYDDISAVFPIDDFNTLAFGLSRFGGESQGNTNSKIPEFTEINTSDYLFVSALAKRWNNLDVGVNLSLLYRYIDQKGFGMRSDLSTRYTFRENFLISILYKGLIPSTSRWESEHWEYEPSDIYLGTGLVIPSQYFYGIFNFAFQTEGIFQIHAKSSVVSEGGRIYESPEEIFLTGNFGLEYVSLSGLILRFGMNEFRSGFFRSSPSFGLSYNYKNIITLDYSFRNHLELDGSHRISITVDPYFGRASGFPRRNTRVSNMKRQTGSLESESSETEEFDLKAVPIKPEDVIEEKSNTQKRNLKDKPETPTIIPEEIKMNKNSPNQVKPAHPDTKKTIKDEEAEEILEDSESEIME